jgi:hypothetical protein
MEQLKTMKTDISTGEEAMKNDINARQEAMKNDVSAGQDKTENSIVLSGLYRLNLRVKLQTS